MKRIFAISALSLLGLWQGASPGQQSKLVPTKGQAALQHEVTVALKLVQVYVTDKKGNPVSDLRRDEFALHDNKDEITITEFERHALSLPGTADPSVDREPVKTLPAPLLNRRFFFLFDLVFTEGKGFRIARDAALRYINTGLLPTDEASVLSFSGGRSLDVRIPLTQDHHAVRKSVESLTMADLLDRFFPERDDEPVRIVSSESASTSDFRPSSGGGPSETRILAGNFIWALKSFAQALDMNRDKSTSSSIRKESGRQRSDEARRGEHIANLVKAMQTCAKNSLPLECPFFRVILRILIQQWERVKRLCAKRLPLQVEDFLGLPSMLKNTWRLLTI